MGTPELEQNILKFVWKHRRPRIAKHILKKKNGAGGIRFPDLRVYYKAILMKTVWWSSHHGAAETNPPKNHEVAGFIPGLALWVVGLVLL